MINMANDNETGSVFATGFFIFCQYVKVLALDPASVSIFRYHETMISSILLARLGLVKIDRRNAISDRFDVFLL